MTHKCVMSCEIDEIVWFFHIFGLKLKWRRLSFTKLNNSVYRRLDKFKECPNVFIKREKNEIQGRTLDF